jgi:hypothetical protein
MWIANNRGKKQSGFVNKTGREPYFTDFPVPRERIFEGAGGGKAGRNVEKEGVATVHLICWIIRFYQVMLIMVQLSPLPIPISAT